VSASTWLWSGRIHSCRKQSLDLAAYPPWGAGGSGVPSRSLPSWQGDGKADAEGDDRWYRLRSAPDRQSKNVRGIEKSIDVEGLPEPVAKAIEQVVRTFKVQLAPKAEPQAPPRKTAHELPRWPGKVIGDLRREDGV